MAEQTLTINTLAATVITPSDVSQFSLDDIAPNIINGGGGTIVDVSGIVTLASQVAELDSEVTVLQTNVSALQEDVSGLGFSVEQAQATATEAATTANAAVATANSAKSTAQYALKAGTAQYALKVGTAQYTLETDNALWASRATTLQYVRTDNNQYGLLEARIDGGQLTFFDLQNNELSVAGSSSGGGFNGSFVGDPVYLRTSNSGVFAYLHLTREVAKLAGDDVVLESRDSESLRLGSSTASLLGGVVKVGYKFGGNQISFGDTWTVIGDPEYAYTANLSVARFGEVSIHPVTAEGIADAISPYLSGGSGGGSSSGGFNGSYSGNTLDLTGTDTVKISSSSSMITLDSYPPNEGPSGSVNGVLAAVADSEMWLLAGGGGYDTGEASGRVRIGARHYNDGYLSAMIELASHSELAPNSGGRVFIGSGQDVRNGAAGDKHGIAVGASMDYSTFQVYTNKIEFGTQDVPAEIYINGAQWDPASGGGSFTSAEAENLRRISGSLAVDGDGNFTLNGGAGASRLQTGNGLIVSRSSTPLAEFGYAGVTLYDTTFNGDATTIYINGRNPSGVATLKETIQMYAGSGGGSSSGGDVSELTFGGLTIISVGENGTSQFYGGADQIYINGNGGPSNTISLKDTILEYAGSGGATTGLMYWAHPDDSNAEGSARLIIDPSSNTFQFYTEEGPVLAATAGGSSGGAVSELVFDGITYLSVEDGYTTFNRDANEIYINGPNPSQITSLKDTILMYAGPGSGGDSSSSGYPALMAPNDSSLYYGITSPDSSVGFRFGSFADANGDTPAATIQAHDNRISIESFDKSGTSLAYGLWVQPGDLKFGVADNGYPNELKQGVYIPSARGYNTKPMYVGEMPNTSQVYGLMAKDGTVGVGYTWYTDSAKIESGLLVKSTTTLLQARDSSYIGASLHMNASNSAAILSAVFTLRNDTTIIGPDDWAKLKQLADKADELLALLNQ